MATSGRDSEEAGEQDSPAQVDPSGRWTRTDDILGKGAFKTVYKGFDEQEGLEIAWNQIKIHDLVSTKEDRERFFAEIRVLKQLKHKNIMTFFDSWMESKGHTVNFITELFTSGTLRQYRKRHKQMDTEVMKRWAWQILCGLVYLHGHNPPIIHRDLKCDNIFINGSEGVVKIGDLGLATMLRARTAPQSVLGTPEFMAPELYDEEYDDRVDVYSFGMCLLELATMEYPYSECRNAAQIYRKVTLGIRPKALGRVASQELAEFVGHCIKAREQRPRSRQLLKHPYFDSIRAERCSVKLSAEALGLPVPEPGSHHDLAEYANSAGSSSVSRTSSAAVPEEDESTCTMTDAVEQKDGKADKPTTAALPTDTAEAQAAAEEREIKVKGRLQEDEAKLNLRLRIQQPGFSKVVEFDFDLASDTAMSVASEMVDEMSLSHSDANRIALAIKEEIFNLTQKPRQPGSVAATERAGSATSDDEAVVARQHAASDSGHAEHSVVANIEPVADPPEHSSGPPTGKDSVMSVMEGPMLDATIRPPPQTQPSLRMTHSGGLTSFATCSPPDSHISFGSSPLTEPMMIDAPQLRATEASHAMKPPAPASLARSDSFLHRLTAIESGGSHAGEAESMQQASTWQGDPNGRMIFAPPKEEDRRLPLQKLLENLQEVERIADAPLSTSAGQLHMHRASDPIVAPLNSVTASHSGFMLPPQSASQAVMSKQPDFRRMSFDCIGSPTSTSGRQSETSNGPLAISCQPMQASRTSSPRQEGAAPLAAGEAARGKSTKDFEELKEARRKAAQTSLKKMESQSLEGLGGFGASGKNCKQVPIKMMGKPG